MRLSNFLNNLSRYSRATRYSSLIGVCVALFGFSQMVFRRREKTGSAIGVGGMIAAILGPAYAYLALRRPTVRRETRAAHVSASKLDLTLRNPLWTATTGSSGPLRLELHAHENADGTDDLLNEAAPSAAALADADVWLLPSARYQLLELVPLARRLREAGISAQLISDGLPSAGVAAEARNWGEEIHRGDLGEAPPRALVVLNDWGPARRFAQPLREKGTLLISKVEGAQDFANLDTPRWRLPYTNSDLVLAQGAYDAENLRAKRVEIVGSSRIEMLAEVRASGRLEEPVRRAVTNLNFSYGTYSSSTRNWMADVAAAHRLVDASLHISLHPAVSANWIPKSSISPWPLALDLETSDVLITRSSTALFDALAIGRRVAYFNPHGERVWKNVNWDTSVPELRSVTALAGELGRVDGAAEATSRRRFLEDWFVSFDPVSSSEDRAAQAIMRLI